MNTKSKENLIDKHAKIQLYFADDMYDRMNRPVPQLPKIQCHLLRKVFSFSWCYLAELKEPLFLDIEGVGEEARKKMTAYYIMITPSGYSSKEDGQDSLYLRLNSAGKSEVIIAYVDEPANVPNELLTGEKSDPYFEELPVISRGIMSLEQ